MNNQLRFRGTFITGEREGQTATVLGARKGIAFVELDNGRLITCPSNEIRFELTDEQKAAFKAVLERILQAWERVREQIKPVIKAIQAAERATQDDFTLAPPQDPRERALWAKEHRNTGPDQNAGKHRGRK